MQKEANRLGWILKEDLPRKKTILFRFGLIETTLNECIRKHTIDLVFNNQN